jgi:chemotaxis response regulator CheB
MCIVLTGIRSDGIDAYRKLNEKSVTCITQDAKNTIVDGMPFQARTLIKNIKVLNNNQILNTIQKFLI